jgi:hypothetical protein
LYAAAVRQRRKEGFCTLRRGDTWPRASPEPSDGTVNKPFLGRQGSPDATLSEVAIGDNSFLCTPAVYLLSNSPIKKLLGAGK